MILNLVYDFIEIIRYYVTEHTRQAIYRSLPVRQRRHLISNSAATHGPTLSADNVGSCVAGADNVGRQI